MKTQTRQVTCIINGQPVPVVSVDVETESIDITSISDMKPDPKWEFTDAAGHYHAYTDKGETPTLEQVGEDYWCQDCNDHHTDYTTQCTLCGEEVNPRRIETGGTFKKSMPGRTTWTMRVLSEEFMRVGDRVSVHLTEEGRESFGVMHVGGGRTEFGARSVQIELAGFLHRRLTKVPT